MPLLALVLFAVFTLLSTAGAYLIAAHFRGRRAGLVAALVTLAFFVALAAGMWALVERYAGL
ncbi:MAG TPA: hypothetical protein VHM02_14025 [Thermoanaerobaculia bacterium]|nr:hypothetical protein [Thermoanaerobaculia bacterium]